MRPAVYRNLYRISEKDWLLQNPSLVTMAGQKTVLCKAVPWSCSKSLVHNADGFDINKIWGIQFYVHVNFYETYRLWHTQEYWHINHQWAGSALVQEMPWCLFSTKPLIDPNPSIDNSSSVLRYPIIWNLIKITLKNSQQNVLKMSSAFCSGLSILIEKWPFIQIFIGWIYLITDHQIIVFMAVQESWY